MELNSKEKELIEEHRKGIELKAMVSFVKALLPNPYADTRARWPIAQTYVWCEKGFDEAVVLLAKKILAGELSLIKGEENENSVTNK